jgi:SAM-dependent methyltransferase
MTATPDFNRWQERFSTPDFLFGKAPNEFLVRCKDLLPRTGKALAVADGEGRNGVFLAQQGLEVTTTEFSQAAIEKARRLAAENNVSVNIIETDVHSWDYPENAFDVVVEIFTQFSTPPERAVKWVGMRSTLRPGGLLIIRGYTPKQLQHGTGGPKAVEQLYTREMLENAFGDFDDIIITEEELELSEGHGHAGMSAVIGLTGRKPE